MVRDLTVLGQDSRSEPTDALGDARAWLSAALRRTARAVSVWGRKPPPPSHAIVSIIELILVALIGAMIARLFWVVWAILFAPPIAAPTSVAQDAPRAIAAAEANPFKTVAPETLVVAPVQAVAETALDLTLHGTWFEKDGRRSAIIQSGGAQKTYSVGDEICCGASLAEVYADHVIISRGGAREILRSANSPEPSAGVAIPAPAPPPSGQRPRFEELVEAQAVTGADGAYRLQLFPKGQPAAFSALGLQAGDILVLVDGAPAPSDSSALLQMLAKLADAGTVSIEVERAGKPLQIELPLDAASAGAALN